MSSELDLSDLKLKDDLKLKEVELFGGAMTMLMPAVFVDISNFRQIPDTQECWADTEDTDQSVIVEILAHEDQVQGAAIAEYYWDDIAQCNEASGESENVITVAPKELTHSLIKTIPTSDSKVAEPSCWVAHGHQRVSKFKEHIPSLDSDVVLHLNRPIEIMPNSRKVQRSAEFVSLEQSGDSTKDGIDLFLAMLHSLRVKDWGLFASP
ncbi:hypothetical protein GUITHDRAFT_112377 [Guillardia theta CCMP2712]|uniref:Uncharacterized protein n=1 Tax=Guillardia theta (strain CCMP2712) TaxID=905079 RepID=L1J0Q0_GUITC|nr:hypothetical protein GUITHDRAFT_112377 [Guillardia theta CCMP2712]EKX41670.1 hypothetical protein GUITHDRAFT_112377 [Guillardia theta CCMP2712]|eukprot:XP_005828650.1 hypothetical protein GUITHDRAFT_112377 [Guillardia theta CCMP2712]